MLSIKSIEIEQLFGTINHQIEFSENDDLTILLGQNGIGKTAILRMLNMLFNHQLSKLIEIPFKSTVVKFTDGRELHVELLKGSVEEVLDYDINRGDFIEATSCSQIADNVKEVLRNIKGYTSENYKNDDDVWIDRKTGECMSAEELIWVCQEKHPGWLVDTKDLYPMWLYNIIDELKVNYIQTQRLQTQVASVVPGRVVSKNIVEYRRTLDIISDEMKTRLERIQREYGQKAAELDQSYPYRLVDNMKERRTGTENLFSLEEALDELGKKRERLMDAGLLSKTKWVYRKLNTNTRSPYVVKAISLYINDTREKFSLFDDELLKIELFRKLINIRFLKKKVIINVNDGIFIESTETGFGIPLERLSSGEQHLLVLYYDLIFRFQAGTLVLIDEPEISLHVSWQKRFISEMVKIMEVNGMKVLIATHSPTLIGKYWHLTRELDKDIVGGEYELEERN